MKVKPIILNSQQTMYAVLMYDLDDDNLDELTWAEIHSHWSSREKAEEVAEFIRWEYEGSWVVEVNYDQTLKDVRGYSVVLDINNYAPYSLRTAILRNELVSFDLENSELVKTAFENNPNLSETVIFRGGEKPHSIPEFQCGADIYDDTIKIDNRWVYKRKAPNAHNGLHVRSFGFTIIEAYESAMEYANSVKAILNNLPEKKCAFCDKLIAKKHNYDNHPVYTVNKSNGRKERYSHNDTVFEKEFMFTCGDECETQLLLRYTICLLDNVD